MSILWWKQLKLSPGPEQQRDSRASILALVSAHRFDGIRAGRPLEHNTLRGGNLLLVFLVLLACMNLAGCATLPFTPFQQQLGRCVSFQELLREGDVLHSERVVLGGHILQTVNEPHGSILTILQTPLDSRNEPQSQDLSEGRFLVQVEEFLDPEIYCKGRKFTVAGIVLEVRSQPLGNRSYPYPVIVGEEFHLWPNETPSVTLYDPYYQYWHYPWHRYPYAPYPWWAW